MEKEPWYIHQLTHDELKLFVDKARTGKTNDKAFIGIVAPAAVHRIEAVCGKKAEKSCLKVEQLGILITKHIIYWEKTIFFILSMW